MCSVGVGWLLLRTHVLLDMQTIAASRLYRCVSAHNLSVVSHMQVTRQAHYIQYSVNVRAAALCAAATQVRGAQQPSVAGLGQLLRHVEDQTSKTCDVGSGAPAYCTLALFGVSILWC